MRDLFGCVTEDNTPLAAAIADPIVGRDYIAATEPMKIGKHLWRMVVYRDAYYAKDTYSAGVFQGYEWKETRPAWMSNMDLPELRWQESDRWPRYDFNHFNYGLPKTLNKLYERNPETVALFKEHRKQALQALKS